MSKGKTYLAILLTVLLILSMSFPILAQETSGDNPAQDVVEQTGGGDNIGPTQAPADTSGSENNDNSGTQALEQSIPAGGEETPSAELVGGENAVETFYKLQGNKFLVGKEIVLEVTTVLAEGIASAEIERFAVELTKIQGTLDIEDLEISIGSENIDLTADVAGGVLRGFWTPAEKYYLNNDTQSVTCSFILKFQKRGAFKFNIFPDQIIAEKAVVEEILLPVPPVAAPVAGSQAESTGEQGLADENQGNDVGQADEGLTEEENGSSLNDEGNQDGDDEGTIEGEDNGTTGEDNEGTVKGEDNGAAGGDDEGTIDGEDNGSAAGDNEGTMDDQGSGGEVAGGGEGEVNPEGGGPSDQ